MNQSILMYEEEKEILEKMVQHYKEEAGLTVKTVDDKELWIVVITDGKAAQQRFQQKEW